MILVDANNIAYIAYYSLGELSEGEDRTGTVFGFLNIVNRIAGQFGNDMVFCFDSKKNIRKEKHPTYKANRHKDLTSEEAYELKQMYKQLTDLRKDVLPSLGFRNVKVSRGYEADDLIAHYALKYKALMDIIIVSTDKDLYQLLDTNVSIYNPRTKKMFTIHDFKKMYKIKPKDWPEIKAIAGDPADNIKGVWKVGEKTAIKFKRGLLSRESKAYEQIAISWGIVLFWEKCIRLPYLGGHDILFGYKTNRFNRIDFIKTFDRLKFVYYLKDEQFERWEKNFNLKKEKTNGRRPSKGVVRNDIENRSGKKVLRKLSGNRKKKPFRSGRRKVL